MPTPKEPRRSGGFPGLDALMFANSVALLLTNDKNWYTQMHALAQQIGFRETRLFPSNPLALGEFRRGPLPFVFACSRLRPEDLGRAMAQVRDHPDLTIRFLPIVMLTDQNDRPTIVKYVELGCDDVITMPLTAAQMIERLRHQVGRPRDYYQSKGYFGPNRRRCEAAGVDAEATREGGREFCRHFTIQRDFVRGITVVNSEAVFPDERAFGTG